MISPGFFIFFEFFFFRAVIGVKGQKIAQDDKNMSGALHISGIIHHMIFIYDTYV